MAPSESSLWVASAVDQAQVFSAWINSLAPPCPRPTISKFVKKLDGIQEVSLPPTIPRMVAFSLAEKGLIVQFTGLFTSPKTVQKWVESNWLEKINSKISLQFCSICYFNFNFGMKEPDLQEWTVLYGHQRPVSQQMDVRL